MSSIRTNRIESLTGGAVSVSDIAQNTNISPADSIFPIGGIPANKLRATKVFGHYVDDRDNDVSVYNGWVKMLAELKSGDIVMFDGMFKTPVQANQLILESKQDITFIGGGFYRWTGCSEHIIRFHACEGIVVKDMKFQGNNGTWFQWGFQGLYFRDCINSRVDSCKFKDIGDAAIRTCRRDDTPYPPSTIGIIISNCFFTNCTQVTTSTTGALKYIFTGNVCENMYSLKIAKRNTDETGWHLVYGNQFNNCAMGLEVQGANRIKYFNNAVVGESLVRIYSNDETYVPAMIGNKDIFIYDNDFEATMVSDCIYINSKNQDASNVTDNTGIIQILNNRLTQNFTATRGSIYLASYTGSKITDSLVIKGNQFLGTGHLNAVSSSAIVPLIMDGMDLDISDNVGTFSSWFVTIPMFIDSNKINGSFRCERNNVTSSGIVDLNIDTFSETSLVLREYVVNNNTFKTVGNREHLKTGLYNKIPTGMHTEIVGNTFKVDETTAGDIIKFCAPPASRVDEFSYLITNNNFLLTGTFNSTTAQPRAMHAPAQNTYATAYPVNSIFRDNIWIGSNARLPRSDNPNIPFSLRNFVSRSKKQLEAQQELIHSSYTTDISGISGTTRNIRVYADRTVEVFGLWKNDTATSFNITYGVTMEDTNYTIIFTPIHTEVLATRVVSKLNHLSVVRFSTLAGSDVSPVFSYHVKGKLTESEMANYI